MCSRPKSRSDFSQTNQDQDISYRLGSMYATYVNWLRCVDQRDVTFPYFTITIMYLNWHHTTFFQIFLKIQLCNQDIWYIELAFVYATYVTWLRCFDQKEDVTFPYFTITAFLTWHLTMGWKTKACLCDQRLLSSSTRRNNACVPVIRRWLDQTSIPQRYLPTASSSCKLPSLYLSPLLSDLTLKLCCWLLIWPIQNDGQKNMKNDWNPSKWVLIWEYSARGFQWIPIWHSLDGFWKSLRPWASSKVASALEGLTHMLLLANLANT